jgi:hypothetical protein
LEDQRQLSSQNEEELGNLRLKVSDLDDLRNEVMRLKDEMDLKDSEIEDKNSNIEVLEVRALNFLVRRHSAKSQLFPSL